LILRFLKLELNFSRFRSPMSLICSTHDPPGQLAKPVNPDFGDWYTDAKD
jgi:hypothetical protein